MVSLRTASPWQLILALTLPLIVVTCSNSSTRPAHAPRHHRTAPTIVSNVLRSDYVGSDKCRPCHEDIFAAWETSPMHRMTRSATPDQVSAPFSSETFEFKGDTVRMFQANGHLFMDLDLDHDESGLFRLTRVIGGRYREDFVGIEVESETLGAEERGEERVMPVSYMLSKQQFRYKGYSVLIKERPHLTVGSTWRKQCIFCHNTVPHLSTLYDDLMTTGARGYQGSVTNDLLPESRAWTATVDSPVLLQDAVHTELEFLGAAPPRSGSLNTLLGAAIAATKARFGPRHFVETGIGCEACHGGGREHIEDPVKRPTFEVRSLAMSERPVGDTLPSSAQWEVRTCMRCHTVLFSRYGPTWEGGHRYADPGGSTINSGEARDFALGGCASELACSSCHFPHSADDPERLQALTGDLGTALCTECHSNLASPAARAGHTHHDPEGPGSSCLTCHMPQKNMGLDYRLTRYHRIGSPNDPARVEGDRPIECSMCHPNESVASLVDTMEAWWGKRYDSRELHRLYGRDLSATPLSITLRYGKPHEQVVAMAWLSASGDSSHSSAIAKHLSHEYPLVRYFAAQSLEDLTGTWPEVDLDGSKGDIDTQASTWLRAFAPPDTHASPQVPDLTPE